MTPPALTISNEQVNSLPLLLGVDLLLKAVQTAQLRTQIAQARPLPLLAASTGLASAINAVQVRQRQQVSAVRAQSLQLDVARLGSRILGR